ncbi:uncharacterized protein Triagg1_7207 [Trichoderma aggressivum f. europaeum]|uniref:Uncharacterized protein n=1 Tax=Trichoderma aggressivum f. europaeum TaxID=173218 RepID=A0AAE1LXZ8_9HYPO|nr:hypothetical protein Triagg1_7207 [Trichoderma aggressivum f. europaeum]
MYPTSAETDGSTAERPRLPPGGFSLEHGFPEWFGGSSRHGSRERRGPSPSAASIKSARSSSDKPPLVPPKDDVPRYMQTDQKTVSTYSLLKYIRSAFDKAEVLDTVPLAAAGNPGAWHAWRTHRRKQRKALAENIKSNRLSRLSILSDLQPKDNASEQGDAIAFDVRSIASQSTMAREPGEWNWDGVWEDRVKKGVASTLTESVLYGASGISDDMCFSLTVNLIQIHFLALEEGTIEAVKGNLRRTLDASNEPILSTFLSNMSIARPANDSPWVIWEHPASAIAFLAVVVSIVILVAAFVSTACLPPTWGIIVVCGWDFEDSKTAAKDYHRKEVQQRDGNRFTSIFTEIKLWQQYGD